AFRTQHSRRVGNRYRGTTVGPTAAERQIHSQSEFSRFCRREAKSINECIGEIRKILNSGRRIVRQQRIDGLNFKTTDAAFFHQAHLTFEFLLRDGWSKPPPAHHDLRVIGWPLKSTLQFGNALRSRRPKRDQNEDNYWECAGRAQRRRRFGFESKH